MSDNGTRAVIVCTEHRGVFYGYASKDSDAIVRDRVVTLDKCRMAIYWGTTRGIMELAETGPTSKSKISARARATLNAVTAVFAVTDAARDGWEAAP